KNLVRPELMERYECVPVRKEGNKLVVAMSDPTNILALDDLRMATGLEIQPALASASQIRAIITGERKEGGPEEGPGPSIDQSIEEAINTIRTSGRVAVREAMEEEGALAFRAGQEVDVSAKEKELAEEAPIIRIVNVLLQQAIKERATDIHIEPQRRNVRIRYRIDGVLHEIMNLPRYVHAPLISRLKIMGDMNIAEKRLPQDGRILIRFRGKEYDIRVSTIPTTFGEKAVLRILDKEAMMMGLENLGFLPDTLSQVEKLISQPQGMILSTGPTGSGKTTTQYSILTRLNTVDKNILTIEEPVEYQLPGINQVSVNRKAGLTFALALRHFLRQDPDVIMVGEIRDLETAEAAIQAALTGHLVLSTLHTNDAPSAITRLIDMGVEPFLIAATVTGVLAQRLARRICTHCKEPYDPPDEVLIEFGLDPKEAREKYTFYRGKGCEHCRHTGYKGRIGLFELMVMNEELADLTLRRAPLSEIRAAARAAGMRTLKDDGLEKVKLGITTFEEVARVVMTVGL
ncbi:MAG TPA: type II/IV secretion system protein, partial [Armatimonadetes bacterium]|nr:type II/IV secretion system protein [Armatimonadota bacterium]